MNFTIDQVIILMISAYKDGAKEYDRDDLIYHIKQYCSIFGVSPKSYILNEFVFEEHDD